MDNYIISGIQQIGIGVENLSTAWKYYIDVFNMDVKILEDENIADIMAPYMGNKAWRKHAVIAINMQGGGGFEIWQHTEHKTQKAGFDIQFGDLGILVAKIKSRNVKETYNDFSKNHKIQILGKLNKSIDGNDTFFIKDPFGNIFQIVQDNYIFKDENRTSGGPVGAILGVSDIDKTLMLYKDILGYDKIIADKTGVFEDISGLNSGSNKYRRILLTNSKPREGSFCRLFGQSYIELIQALDREPQKIYKNRFWGDSGFIHLCFDIKNMNALKLKCKELGFPFTIDSCPDGTSFNMGEAAGHFTYTEDPDGTLIEFVETHKIPIIKKFGIYLNLRNKDPKKPLKNWLLKALKFGRVSSKNI